MRARRLILAAFHAVPVAGCGFERTDPSDLATAVPPSRLEPLAFPLRLSEAGVR